MIEFRGFPSSTCLKYVTKRIKIMFFLCFFIPCLIVSIPFIILSFIKDWIYILVIILPAIPFLTFLPIDKKSLGSIIPSNVKIDSDNLISSGENFNLKRNVYQVSKVVDFGEWYYIFFKFPYINQSFICQKNLIVEGSIEQFENMFKDKIIKSKKHRP